MAASGLNPRDQVRTKFACISAVKIQLSFKHTFCVCFSKIQGKSAAYHLSALVDFALSMKESLEEVNTHSFNNFKLRIGKLYKYTVLVTILTSQLHGPRKP